jgi:hypothetical protein
MHDIDLKDFSLHERKIPAELLMEKQATPVSGVKVFTAYSLDLVFVNSLALYLTLILDHFITAYIPTIVINQFQSTASLDQFYGGILPLVGFSYFFFCYFFNQGQSFGKYFLKLRIHMPIMSFRSSFRWAVASMSVFMTLGLSLPLMKFIMKGMGSFEVHDHLYNEFMRHKDSTHRSLTEETHHVELEEYEYQKVA